LGKGYCPILAKEDWNRLRTVCKYEVRRVAAMTIEIHRPELEALIQERMKSGAFENIEDVLMQALRSEPSTTETLGAPKPQRPEGRKSLAQLFAESPFKGLDIDFERDPD
jgi:hypothetical protein